MKLFDRFGRTPILTDAGATLFSHAQRIFMIVEEA